MGRELSTNGEKRNSYGILVGKLEGTRPLRRPRHRPSANMSLDIGEIGWGAMNWIYLA